MHFLAQTVIAAAFLAGAVFSVPSPQGTGVPGQGGGGGVQGSCYWKCCEWDPSGPGTLCRANDYPYPHGADCSINMEDYANMTCCHQTNCSDQTQMPKPIRVA